MNWNETHISHIVADFAEENAFACRALFRVTGIRFTNAIPSLAVTLTDRPELLINRDFINTHAGTENDIKALLMHEFLHVLLLHTEKFKITTPLLNIALDAIVNAIIHRTYGEAYSGFFARFYPWEGMVKLLRPAPGNSYSIPTDSFDRIHKDVYSGRFSGEDLHELLNYLHPVQQLNGALIFIGNHDPEQMVISPENGTLLEEILRRMDGTGIWNKPGMRGTGGQLTKESAAVARFRFNRWKTGVRRILAECMTPDPKRRTLSDEEVSLLPLLSSRDRRALSLLGWSGLLPLAIHSFPVFRPVGSVTVYIDVSGSMEEELRLLVHMLGSFRKVIKYPIWSISDTVTPTKWSGGKLLFRTTGGTTIGCVFDHIRNKGFHRAVIITDGYVETITPEMVEGIPVAGLRAIITPAGNTTEFSRCGMKYHQLSQLANSQ